MPIDSIELSRELIAFNTINPPGSELTFIQHLEKILAGAGLETRRFNNSRSCQSDRKDRRRR